MFDSNLVQNHIIYQTGGVLGLIDLFSELATTYVINFVITIDLILYFFPF
jgi:hypothetical protein